MANQSLCNYLRELRKSYGYSQEFVASHLNIIRQTYSHYETGRIVPPLDALYHLAELFKVPVGKLLELSTDHVVKVDYDVEITSANEEMLSVFLDYVNRPENTQAFKGLNRQEKEMLFYYKHISPMDQQDILDFIKIKYRHTQN